MGNLEGWMTEIRIWLLGKKTYLLAVLLVVTVLALVLLGRLTPETALTVALVFAGLLSASFRSAIELHHAEVMDVLEEVAEAGAALRAGNKAGAVQVVREAAIKEAPAYAELLAKLNEGAAAAAPTTFHVGGNVSESAPATEAKS
jgi:hypothetical protein